MKKIILIISSLYCSFVYTTEEFLYPVDVIIHNETEKLCILHQKGNQLELWFWDPLDNTATKGLLSSFTPAGLTVLHDKKGFSFIDNDRVRIKHVEKRSPKSVDLYGPYDLTTLHWIDEKSFYFAAKERQHSNLFHATVEGDIFRLTLSNYQDYLYPQKIGNKLFYIEHDRIKGYCIKYTDYPSTQIAEQESSFRSIETVKAKLRSNLDDKERSYTPLLEINNAQMIVDFKHTTIAFLSMQSDTLGFVLEHPAEVNRNDEAMKFLYHMIYSDKEGMWHHTQLFEFSIPLYLMLPQKGRNRLYESILPLLPFYDDYAGEQKIYFSDYSSRTDTLDVFSYCLTTHTIQRKTQCQFFSQSYFPPRRIKDTLFCGGSIINNLKDTNPQIDIDISGTQYFSFLQLKEKS